MSEEKQRCGSCKALRPLSEFSPSYRGKTGTWCRACFAAYAAGVRDTIPHEPQTCEACGNQYVPKQLKQSAKFCSRACKSEARKVELRAARLASKPTDRVCVHCGILMPQSMRVDAKFCSVRCNESAHQLKRKLRARGADAGLGHVDGYVRAQIAERDKWRCGICGGRVSKTLRHPNPRAGSLDHVVPVSQGGTSDPANLRLTHLVCNLRRRDRGGNEQLAVC